MYEKFFLTIAALITGLHLCYAQNDSITVNLNTAHRSILYKSALLVDGVTMKISNRDLSANGGNEIAVLVVNGGHLVLDHCTITKTGDGIRVVSSNDRDERRQGRGGDEMRMRPDGNHRQRPDSIQRPRRQDGDNGLRPDRLGRRERPNGQHGDRPDRNEGNRPGRPGGGNGDDSFNFYGLNSAVVAVGEGSCIEMIGCKVNTDAEFANAVFSCDNAHVIITDGITIDTSKNSSRGLYATCAGVIEARGDVNIHTKGAHCAALATDRGGGTVIVGKSGTNGKSVLITEGSGSPCIYSTGDISAYNATGNASSAQTMVVEGKNTITIENCDFSGNSPKHGGIMLYQSTSGDASEGTSVLTMKDCCIRDNSGTALLLVTNTHSIVNIDNCIFLNATGVPLASDDPLVTCRNCNGDGHRWGREGSNGGQIEINLKNQKLMGTLLANEEESSISVSSDASSNINGLKTGYGKGTVSLPKK